MMLEQRHTNRVKGLCGNYNFRTDDDLLTRTGSYESRPSVFGESWKLSDSCPDIQQDVPDETTTPCGTVNGVSSNTTTRI